jgi:hypothetical protein
MRSAATPRTAIRVAAAAALAAGLAAVSAVPAEAQARVRTGTLRCSVAPGVAIVIGSRSLACSFRSTRGQRESYAGRLTKVGFNFGVTGRGVLVWGVFEPAGRHSIIDGTYVGATGEASLGAGIGANALVGGTNDSVALQPLSIQGQTGLNIALGGASLTLQRSR